MGRKRSKKKNIYKEILGSVIVICIIIFCYFTGNFDIFSQDNEEFNSQNIAQIDNQSSNQSTNESNNQSTNQNNNSNVVQNETTTFDLSTIPKYSGNPYVEINGNIPYFAEEDYTKEPFENYSELDILGRSGVAYANICKEIMPPEDAQRGEIGGIKPSGWIQKRYDNLIKDKYLYNRCHLIGWQLAGENANKNNLITGTRYLNTEGMLPFENEVAGYLNKNKSNHVLYRVTPIFENNNLLASGVEMEAWSIEDSGKGVQFNVYCYNVQPGIVIDYATGESHEK